jgi:hypothetical protein
VLGPHIEISVSLENSSVSVVSEPTQLELAILNLALNARGAIPNGGGIRIARRTVEVSDQPDVKPGLYVEIGAPTPGIGLDLPKYVFEIHGVDAHGTTIIRKTLRRNAVSMFFANLPPSLVDTEASNGAHFWAKMLG